MPSFTLTRPQALTVAALALIAVFAAARFLGGTSGGGGAAAPAAASSADVPPLTAPAMTPTPPAATVLVVDVAGAVRRPGLYRLPPGSRIADAVARAGGLSRHAARAAVNLAAPLADGEQVLVPSGAGGVAAAAAAPGGAPSATAPVDLNTATAEQLDALPGVGPSLQSCQ